MTLREYIIFWQETYDKHQSRPTTYAAHNYVFKNHILPGLGDIPLSELTSEMVGEFLEERRRFGNHRPGNSGLGEEAMRHIHRLLQQCLDHAMRDGLIGANPARAFHYSKPKKVNANVLTPLEMEDYLDAAERLGHLPMFMLALLQNIDAKDRIAEDTSIDSFISRFELVWKLSTELNHHENGHLVSCRTGRPGAHFTSKEGELK